MDINNISYKKISKFILLAIALFISIYLVFKLSIFFMPFVIAFVVSTLIEPLVKHATTKLRLPRKLAVIIILAIIIAILGYLLTAGISKLVQELGDLINMLPNYLDFLKLRITTLINTLTALYFDLPDVVTSNIEISLQKFTTSLESFLLSLLKGTFNTIVSLPRILIFVIITILSTFFMSSDRELIKHSLAYQFSTRWVTKARSISNDLLLALGGYVRAQLIMMSITFTELFLAFFFVLKLKYSLVLALIISLIDAFPIVGTGTILIPWAIYNLISGYYYNAAILFILYGFVLGIRQLLEPKIVGEQIGIHPLLTLFAMYTGANLIGVIGLIVGPIVLIILKNIFSQVLEKGIYKEMSK